MLRQAVRAGNRLVSTPVDARSALRRPLERLLGDGLPALRSAVDGRVVLVTGASSGIGRATAERLGAAGATVLLVARSEDQLDEVRDAITNAGGVAFSYRCDLADLEQVDALVTKVLDAHGQVDVLVNNAGLSIRRKVRHSYERFWDFERPMQLNYFAAIRLTLGLLPQMVEREYGQVVNITSWAVLVRPARFSGYVASKAALEAWSDSVQAEVLDDGVVFTNVRMPLVRTPMIAPTRLYRQVPALTPEQAAHVVGEAIVTRSRRVSPLASIPLVVADLVSPRAGDHVRRFAP
jgi:short-subunit dehydrogenase